MYSIAAIRKLLLEVFGVEDFETERHGMSAPVENRREWVMSLVERLKSIDRVACYPYWQVPEGAEVASIKFIISPPESNVADEKKANQKPEEFLLTLDCRVFVHRKTLKLRRGRTRNYVDVSMSNGKMRNGLWIVDCTAKRCDADIALPVTRIEQIEELIDQIKAAQDSTSLKHARKIKITGFRQRGLKSRLKELSNEHRFSFRVGYNARDVNLSLRVTGPRTNSKIEYHLAFSQTRFDDVLTKIPDLISRLSELADLGISFHTDNRKWTAIQSECIRLVKSPSAPKTLFSLD